MCTWYWLKLALWMIRGSGNHREITRWTLGRQFLTGPWSMSTVVFLWLMGANLQEKKKKNNSKMEEDSSLCSLRLNAYQVRALKAKATSLRDGVRVAVHNHAYIWRWQTLLRHLCSVALVAGVIAVNTQFLFSKSLVWPEKSNIVKLMEGYQKLLLKT